MDQYTINSMSDAELATCVDEYVKRAMTLAHRVHGAESEYMTLNIRATCHNIDEEYEIAHEVSCGWGTTVTLKGSNAINAGVTAMTRYLDDKAIHRPTKVTPLLAAPEPEEPVEYAEVEEVTTVGDEFGPF
jgi:hypothetical protein